MSKFQIPLCKTFKDEGKLPKGNWIIEPKYDGLRCLVFIDVHGNITFKSRTNKKIYNTEFIELQLSGLKLKNVMLDAELQGADWNQTLSVLHTQTKHPEIKEVELYIFDMISLTDWIASKNNVSLLLRKVETDKLVVKCRLLQNINIIEGHAVEGYDEAKKIYDRMLTMGFEGVVLKEAGSTYPFKRSDSWLKWKPFYTFDLEIKGAIEGLGKHVGRLGAFICEYKGKKVKVGTGLTDIQREAYWSKDMIGQIIEVKCQEITKSGVLRFPSFVRLRGDK